MCVHKYCPYVPLMVFSNGPFNVSCKYPVNNNDANLNLDKWCFQLSTLCLSLHFSIIYGLSFEMLALGFRNRIWEVPGVINPQSKM